MRNRILCLSLGILSLLPSALRADSASQELWEQGLALFNRGFYEKSVQYFEKAVQADPNDRRAYEDMGNAYFKMGDHPNALTAYQKALAIEPNDPTLQVLVKNLEDGSEPQAPSSSTRPFQPTYQTRPSNAGIHPIGRARMWTKISLGYGYSDMAEMIGGADGLNREIAANPPVTGSGTMSHDGLNLGFELGFLLDPHNGLAFGLKYIRASDYKLIENWNNGFVTAGTYYPSDYEDLTLQNSVIPLTLDYYLFLPDAGGRFFLTAGVGYYFGIVHAEQGFSNYVDGYNNGYAGTQDSNSGDLTSGAVGFQFGIGREFAVGPNLGLTVFASGRVAKLTRFTGDLANSSGYTGNFGLANFGGATKIVDLDNTGYIGGNGESYATEDFSGFDIGMALSFYSF